MKKRILSSILLAVALMPGVSLAEEQTDTERVADRELQKKRHYMRRFDANGDGKLTLAEFTAMTKSEYEKKGETGWEEEAAKRFKHKDSNEDGFVTPEELILSLVKLGLLPAEAAEGLDKKERGVKR